MNVYTCNDFVGYYPVGSAAVVVAEDEDSARQLLVDELKSKGLQQVHKLSITYVNTHIPLVRILCDGDY